MAKLVDVYRSEDYNIERRQLPMAIDDKLKMVIQFTDTCVGCNQIAVKQRELERFVQKYQALSSDEVAVALMVTNKEIFNSLAQLVPCVGCRKSVERLFKQLVESGHPAIEPLVITHASGLSIERNVLFEPKALYALFYIHGSKLNMVMESIPKSKKNKRCVLHSLDAHKTKTLGIWRDVWDIMSIPCRDEIVLIDYENLMVTLESYLRKHRFCSECKAKVLRAYSILVEESEVAGEKGYCKALYDGLSCCQEKKHVHISSDTDYIAKLISRAEPELTGSSRRERHAKTLDIAQEEVLTCIGIHLYDRLHRIWQKIRAEEQTWQILFYLGVDALRKNFEMELERKQGITQLELTCQELFAEEQAQEQKREQKRQKRKKRKNKAKNDLEDQRMDVDYDKGKENCQCVDNGNVPSVTCASCEESNHDLALSNRNGCSNIVNHHGDGVRHGSVVCRSDCGYSSGHEGCDSCSMPSSNDGSEIACHDGVCDHNSDSPLCHRTELPDTCQNCSHSLSMSPKHSRNHKCGVRCGIQGNMLPENTKYGTTRSLEDMLEASCSSDEEGDFISEEEIQRFKANQKKLDSQRQELRETLRQRFANMCMCRNPNCPDLSHARPQNQSGDSKVKGAINCNGHI